MCPRRVWRKLRTMWRSTRPTRTATSRPATGCMPPGTRWPSVPREAETSKPCRTGWTDYRWAKEDKQIGYVEMFEIGYGKEHSVYCLCVSHLTLCILSLCLTSDTLHTVSVSHIWHSVYCVCVSHLTLCILSLWLTLNTLYTVSVSHTWHFVYVSVTHT